MTLILVKSPFFDVMATEIEHKYLVIDHSFEEMACERHEIAQGYLCRDKGRTVRVRIWDEKAFITIKGPNDGAVRTEFEYPVPVCDAKCLLALCQPPVIRKTRSIVAFEGNRWEVDTFHGVLEGLITAEIEIPTQGYLYKKPPFVGRDVTGDRRFYNSQLTTIEALKSAF